jgi:hypothetical protein
VYLYIRTVATALTVQRTYIYISGQQIQQLMYSVNTPTYQDCSHSTDCTACTCLHIRTVAIALTVQWTYTYIPRLQYYYCTDCTLCTVYQDCSCITDCTMNKSLYFRKADIGLTVQCCCTVYIHMHISGQNSVLNGFLYMALLLQHYLLLQSMSGTQN